MFTDRVSAGRELASVLEILPRSVLLAIPTGGCIVAGEIARATGLSVRALITTKIRAPIAPELALGAVAPDGIADLDRNAVLALRLKSSETQAYIEQARCRVETRLSRYQDYLPRPEDLQGRHAIIVDDGIATGHTIAAAVDYVRRQEASAVTVAVPVASPEAVRTLGRLARVVALTVPPDFMAVGQYYMDFRQLDDDEAIDGMSGPHA